MKKDKKKTWYCGGRKKDVLGMEKRGLVNGWVGNFGKRAEKWGGKKWGIGVFKQSNGKTDSVV